MKMIRAVLMCAVLAAPLATAAQQASTPMPAPEAEGQQPSRRRSDRVFVRTPGPGDHEAQARAHVEAGMMRMKQPLGKWWKNSEIVKEVGVTPQQVTQLETIFMDHRLKLIDLRADLERQEARLEPLIEADQPDETKVGAQIDLVGAARGRLEKANTLMMLAIRKTLSVEQWKKLQEMHPPMGMPFDRHIEILRERGERELRFKVEPSVRPAPRPPAPTIEEL